VKIEIRLFWRWDLAKNIVLDDEPILEVIYEKDDYEKIGTNRIILLKVKIGNREFKKNEMAKWIYIHIFINRCIRHVNQVKFIESKILVI
jgi:hypothetical protein